MIRIINSAPGDWPADGSVPKRRAELKCDLYFKSSNPLENFGFSKMGDELCALISALIHLPCEAEITLTIKDGGEVSTSGRIWLGEQGDVLIALEEAVQDIEARAIALATRYPTCKVDIDYKMQPD